MHVFFYSLSSTGMKHVRTGYILILCLRLFFFVGNKQGTKDSEGFGLGAIAGIVCGVLALAAVGE